MKIFQISLNCFYDAIIFKNLKFCVFSVIADEQERVQKKTFTNWINMHLAQHQTPMHMDELFEDIRDGVRLICLLEVLSGERLPKEKGTRLRRLHFLSNVKTALDFLERRRVRKPILKIYITSIHLNQTGPQLKASFECGSETSLK